MSELTLFLLQLAFLGLLWAFIFAIVYALRTDLFGPARYRQEDEDKPTAKSSADQPPKLSPAPSTPSGIAQSLIVTGGPKGASRSNCCQRSNSRLGAPVTRVW